MNRRCTLATLYYHVEADYYSDYGVTMNPDLPDDVSFVKGEIITVQLPDPMEFEVNFPSDKDVPHFIGFNSLPVLSELLLKTIMSCGVDNFQTFPAILKNPETGKFWKGFFALNVIGILAAADPVKSESDIIMEGDPDGVDVPLVGFNTIVLDKSKTYDMLMFRLAESPSTLLIHDTVYNHIVANKPATGWNFIATEVDAV